MKHCLVCDKIIYGKSIHILLNLMWLDINMVKSIELSIMNETLAIDRIFARRTPSLADARIWLAAELPLLLDNDQHLNVLGLAIHYSYYDLPCYSARSEAF